MEITTETKDKVKVSVSTRKSWEGLYFAVVRVGTTTRRTEVEEREEAAFEQGKNMLYNMIAELGVGDVVEVA